MAATPLDAAAAPLVSAQNYTDVNNDSSSSFDFNIYVDGCGFGASGMDPAGAMPEPANIPPPLLPGGRCNFADLTPGSGGAQCGCRRFWSRTGAGQTTSVAASLGFGLNNSDTGLDFSDSSQSGWCMCSHHACFHDHSPPAPSSSISPNQPLTSSSLLPPSAPAPDTSSRLQQGAAAKETGVTDPSMSAASILEQENERPRLVKRTPLSPVQDVAAFQALSTKDMRSFQNEDQTTEGFLNKVSFAFPAGFSGSIGSSFADLLAGAANESNPRDNVPSANNQNPSAAASAGIFVPPAPPSVTPTSVASSIIVAPADGGSIPDTMSWAPNNVGLSPGNASSTRPPSAFPSPPAPPSVASSTSQRYSRPFAGRGLHTLKHAAASTSLLRALPPPPEHAVSYEGQAAGGGLGATPQTNASSVILDRGESHNSMSSVVQAHEMRLEKLENPSFSFFPGHEECQDKHDHIDMRVTELESRVDEVEKRLNNNDDASTTVGGGSFVFSRRRLLGSNDDDDDDNATTASAMSTSVASRVSAAANAAATATSLSSADRTEIFSQLQALQTQVSLLQSASLPSYSSPWELEVAFLPFPLKGIWIEASQFPTTSDVAAATAAQRRQSGNGACSTRYDDDEWTQMPNTLSLQTPDPQLPGARGAAATTDWRPVSSAYSDAPRLLPRAYLPGRMIDNRLKSRGLVQTLSVRGADARSLQLAIANAFGHIFRATAASPPRPRNGEEAVGARSRPSVEALHAHLLGLQHPWVPLRKVRKDSRLRFLTRAEMQTPTMWDASFLMSSVVMKASGLHRLYITHPDAYLQDRHAYRCGWSWKRLREMGQSSEKASSGKLGHESGNKNSNIGRAPSVGADDGDPCWAWDSRLDDAPSQSSPSLSSRYRPSPSPFSRGTTPTNVVRPASFQRAVHHQSHQAAATAQNGDAPVAQLSRASFGGHSGSTQQFFTVAQSPMQSAADGRHPATYSVLSRSISPFSYVLAPHSRRLTTSASSRPPPIRTVSMPAPPVHARRPSPMAISLSPLGGRRVRSDGNRAGPFPSSNHQPNSTRAAYDGQRHSAQSMTRPSPHGTAFSSPAMRNGDFTSNSKITGPAVVEGGITKRRRSTRSPSVNWARNTPRRSMSRSSSVVHAAPTTAWAVEKPARGSTPFCYATPYSNAPAVDPPVSSSSSARHFGRQGNRGPPMHTMNPYNGNNDDYDDHDMLGYGNEEGLDLDYPMTQDGDEIEVYEDEADALDDLDAIEMAARGSGGNSGNTITIARYRERQGHVLPEDEPWPGIEEDDNNDHGHGYADDLSHSQGYSQSHDEASEDMSSDSENVEPVSFDADMEEAGVAEEEEEPTEVDDNNNGNTDNNGGGASPHSDVSSQPSEYPITRHMWRASQGDGSGGDGVLPADAGGRTADGKARLPCDGTGFGPQPYAGSHGRRGRSGTEAGDIYAGIGFRIHEDVDTVTGTF